MSKIRKLYETSKKSSEKGYREERPWLLIRDDDKVEAQRYRKSEGSSLSGWIVRSVDDPYHYSDIIPTKEKAIETLLQWGGH